METPLPLPRVLHRPFQEPVQESSAVIHSQSSWKAKEPLALTRGLTDRLLQPPLQKQSVVLLLSRLTNTQERLRVVFHELLRVPL